jgi:hypothetical protein
MALSKDDIFASEEEELNLMTLFADDEEKPADDKPADDDKGDDDKKDDDKPADDDKGGDDNKKDDDDDDADGECCKSALAYEAFMFENCDDLFEESGDKTDPDAAPAADDKGDDDKKDDDKKDDDKPADDDKGADDKPEDKDDDNKPEKEEGKECGLNSDEEFAFDDIDVFACGAGCSEKKADEEPEIDDADGVSNDASNALLNDSLFSGLSDF